MKFTGERVVLDYGEITAEMRFFAGLCGVSEEELRVDMERIIARHLARYYFAERLLAQRNGPIAILDAACGSGYGTYILAGQGLAPQRSAIGVDLDGEAIEYATSQFTGSGLALEYLRADCRTLPWTAPTFDVVTSFETLEHLDRDDGARFVECLSALLRPGGVLVISTPAPRPEIDNPFHLHEYDLTEFEALLAAHFPFRRLFDQGFISGSAILPNGPMTNGPMPKSARERLDRQPPVAPPPVFCPPAAGVAPQPFVRHHIAVCSRDPLPGEIAAAIVSFEPVPVDVRVDHFLG